MAGIDFQAIGQNIFDSVKRMSGPQRLTLALAFLATVMAVFLVAYATGGTPMSPLFTDLEPETAAAVTAELDSQGVSYELTGNGRIVNVPSNQRDQLRIDLAATDLPGSGDGWGLLENQSLMATTADRTVAYQRAMQGELARTISVIDGVSSAAVHLVIPERDILVDDGKQASASVLLVTGSNPLTSMQVNAIVNLVASSVEGLSADQISVTNDAGQVLAAPGDASGALGLDGDIQFQASRQFEANLESRLETLLTTVVGVGGAQVVVSAELDYDSVLTTSETHTPIQTEGGDQLLSQDTTRNEIYRGEDIAADEEGQVAVELPDDAIGDDAGTVFDEGVQYGLDEKDSIYVVDRVVTNAESAPGAVRSLSVSVVIDEAAVDAARLPELESAIEVAAGIRAERGDVLAVSLLPLNEEVKAALAAQNAVAEEAASSGGGLNLVGLLRSIGTVIVAVVALIFGLKYVSRGPQRRVVDSLDLTQVGGGMVLNAAGELVAGEEESEEARALREERAKAAAELAEEAEGQLQSLIANQTDDVAGVLKQWLNDAEEVAR